MKANKEIAEEVADNIFSNAAKLYDSTKYYTDKMKEAETVEEIMDYKKKILLKWLNNFPIYNIHCYFCELLHDNCVECPYAEYHGECNFASEWDIDNYVEDLRKVVKKYEEDLSDWLLIQRLIEVLRETINDRYYIGEKYEVGQSDAP